MFEFSMIRCCDSLTRGRQVFDILIWGSGVLTMGRKVFDILTRGSGVLIRGRKVLSCGPSKPSA
jgi:hypothetical protein